MSDFSIRPVARADVPALLAMIRELADYEHLSHLVTATEAEVAEELFGERRITECLVALEGAVPVGYAIYFHNFSTFLARRGLYLEDIYVRPSHRHRGCGKALLLATARVAHERRCGRFEWMALDWNEPAIRFYQSLGAELLPEWRLFRVTGDAIGRLAALDDGVRADPRAP